MIYTDAIVLKQIKTGDDRRILVLFTDKLGKISAASKTTYHSKSKSSAVLQPFNYGRYTLYTGKDIYNISFGEVIKSFYKIGENIEKYAYCAYILEFTDKILAENQRDTYLFELLTDFLEIMEKRNKEYLLIVRAYEIKSLIHMGIMPQLNECVRCGNSKNCFEFSIKEGGVICESCSGNSDDKLIYSINTNIIEVIQYITNNSLKNLEKLRLEKKVLNELNSLITAYIRYHLDLSNMKSIEFLNTCLADGEKG